jgi:hypothetical protein
MVPKDPNTGKEKGLCGNSIPLNHSLDNLSKANGTFAGGKVVNLYC